MLAVGRHSVEEALRGDLEVEKILVARNIHLPRRLSKLIEEKGVKVQVVPRAKLDALSGGLHHQGIIAVIPEVPLVSAESIVERALGERGLVLVLDGIQDPQNAGNIIRTAEAFGVTGIIMSRSRSVPLSEAVVRASAGAALHIPIARRDGLASFLLKYRGKGLWIAALETGGEDIENVDVAFPLALIAGSEGAGVRKSLLKIADFVLTIPMFGKVSSLNVSSSTAIALYVLSKKRGINCPE